MGKSLPGYVRPKYVLSEAQKEHKRAYSTERKVRIRTEAIEAYGGRCVCCGEVRTEFLQLDHHTELSGAEHRAMIREGWSKDPVMFRGGNGAGQNTYLWLRKNGYPPIVQVLCANCHFAMSMRKERKCPHAR